MKSYKVLGYEVDSQSGTVGIPDDAIPLDLENTPKGTYLLWCLIPVKEKEEKEEEEP